MRLAALVLSILTGVSMAATPIKNLKLDGAANGAGNTFTNLADVVLTNGVKLSTVGGGVGSITNILSSSARLTVTNGSGPEVSLSLDVSGLATGTPLYEVDLSPYATGTPIYSVAGLATGTPLYAFTESDPVWGAASTGYLTKVSAASLYATSGAWNASVGGASNLAQSAYDAATAAQATASTVFAGQDTTGAVTSAGGDSGKYLKADGSWDTPTDTTGFVSPAVAALEMGTYPVTFSQPIPNSPGTASLYLSATNFDDDPWPIIKLTGVYTTQFIDFGLDLVAPAPSNNYVLTYTATDSTWRAKAASGGDMTSLSNGLINVGLTATNALTVGNWSSNRADSAYTAATQAQAGVVSVGLVASNAYARGGTSGLNWSAISNAPANITTQGTITAASIGAIPNTMTTNTVPLFWNSSVPATTNDFIGFTYGSTLTTRSGGTNYSFAAFVNAATNVYVATASADFSWPLLPTTVTSIELHHACISSANASLVYEFAATDRGWSYITTQTVANTGLNITTNLMISGTALTNAAPGQLWSVKVTGSGGCTNTANPAFFGPRTLFKAIGQ